MTSSEKPGYMTCAEFIKTAIAFERESAEFYRAMQEKGSGSVLELLKLLERQELQHERTLKAFVIDSAKAMIQFPPELSSAMPGMPAEPLALAELIELAIVRERRAQDVYRHAAQSVTGGFRDLLNGLARFEEEHEESLKGLRGL